MKRFHVGTIAWLLVCVPSVFAQGTAQINGVIRDATGAVVPGANITAINADTQAQRKTASNGDGGYVVPLLTPGNYRISVEKAGFQSLVRSGIRLEVDQVATIDLSMQVGNVNQAVEVVASGPLLADTNSQVGAVV